MRFRIARTPIYLSAVVAMVLLGSAASQGSDSPYGGSPVPHHVVVQEAPYRTIAFIVPVHLPIARSAKQLPTGLPPSVDPPVVPPTTPAATPPVVPARPTPPPVVPVVPAVVPPVTPPTPVVTPPTTPPVVPPVGPAADPPVDPPMVDGVPAAVFAAWSKVNICEEGGSWAASGPAYPDGLGISARNWVAYGGGTNLSPAAQISVAQRIEAAAGMPGYVPDQGGCANW